MSDIFKVCTKCNINQSLDNYSKDKTKKTGYHSVCKSCKKIYMTKYFPKYQEKNREKLREKSRKYFEKNRFQLREYFRLSNEKYRKKNKQKIKDYKRKYYHLKKQNRLYSISLRLRNRLRSAFKAKNWRKINSFNSIIGCDKKTLVLYIESKFQPGMSWENYGHSGWHIDHIIPLSSAKTIEELQKLNHYTNLQPLWAKDNYKKGSLLCLHR